LPLVRLLQLVMILQRGRFPNVRQLAEACAVSRRTIYRDLATLEAAGITVVYRADRQGYQLAGEGFLPPAQLDDQEALALLLLSRLCPANQVFGLLRQVRSGLDKVILALPVELRGRIALGSELIAGDPATGEFPAGRRPIYEAIWWALVRRRQMRLWYREDSRDSLLTTKFSLYRLAWIDGCWSVVGRSMLHREVRLFRIPWIQRVEVTDEPYAIPPRFRLERWLSRSHGESRSDTPCEVQLRFTPRAAPVVQDAQGPIGQRLSPLASGELDVFLNIAVREETVLWILGFGDQVEVLKPEGLRRAVRSQAERIARIHDDPAE
jgi:predicted DNA-binding transcriptional regulator YafY